jgi:hypothetical protein
MPDEFDKRLDDVVERFFRVVRSQICDAETAAITSPAAASCRTANARTLLVMGQTLERLVRLMERRARKRSRT